MKGRCCSFFRRPGRRGPRARWLAVLGVMWCLAASATRAQVVPVGDVLEDYVRLLQLRGTDPALPSHQVRPLRSRPDTFAADATEHPWRTLLTPGAKGPSRFELLDPQVYAFWNTARAFGQNDGPVWQGRGGTAAVSFGAVARLGVLTAVLRPRFFHARNTHYPLSRYSAHPGRSAYATPLRPDIDLPQRFGPDPYTRFDLGDSYVRADYRGIAAGVSNENMWWGPARRNALLMSNHAPGFVHAFVGTSGAADVGVGRLEARWLWGALEESPYFDEAPENDRRFITGAVAAFSPEALPGLSLGAARVIMLGHDVERRLVADYLGAVVPARRPGARWEAGDLRMFTLFGRWVLPANGFELYGEWGLGNRRFGARELLAELDRGRAFTLGFQKSFDLGARRLGRLGMEVTTLEAPREVGRRLEEAQGGGYFYTHPVVAQGYTHRGQVLGAGIGPGANSQHLQFDVFGPSGRIGIFGFRQTRDNDRYYSRPEANLAEHEVWVGGGLQGYLVGPGFELGLDATYVRLLNEWYLFFNDRTNLNLALVLRSRFSRIR